MKKPVHQTKDFEFKQFAIKGEAVGMPVSTDGVLLGAWANIDHQGRLLDIGTGTGLLALMCAQRQPEIEIDAIDIDEHAYQAAKLNACHSPWSERIHVHLTPIQHYMADTLYQSIICNPPFFNHGESSTNAQRALARHSEQLPHKTLIKHSADLMSETGHASFVLPRVEGEAFIELCLSSGLHLHRLCQVKPTPTKPVSRLLFQVGKQPRPIEHQSLTIHNKQGYSDDFIALTHDFYLKM